MWEPSCADPIIKLSKERMEKKKVTAVLGAISGWVSWEKCGSCVYSCFTSIQHARWWWQQTFPVACGTGPVQPSGSRWARTIAGTNTCRCRPLPTCCAAGELRGRPALNTYVTIQHAVKQLVHALLRCWPAQKHIPGSGFFTAKKCSELQPLFKKKKTTTSCSGSRLYHLLIAAVAD